MSTLEDITIGGSTYTMADKDALRLGETAQSIVNKIFSRFMLLDALFRGMIFGVGVLVVVFLTAVLLIKIMLASQENGRAKAKLEKQGASSSPTSDARSTNANSSALNDEDHAHLLSRKVIPIKSTDDFTEELEISVMEEDD
ncbi:LAQU0S01e16138g1_1 [Lachancea quebecensis]|uniref:LAQU0S01e16138g1_1 n=1 Tax=Lachancea quebecensis TaxID=1654605 RepID=A0A0N7MKZ5_9SACH|nr:LAQU0S01e16138g1_1 [Lachancea quebecensis]